VAVAVRVLGDVEARIDGRPVELGHARQRCVLVALLVEPNRVVPTEQMVDRVWGDQAPQRAADALYSYMSRLRRALSASDDLKIVRRPGGYVLTVDPMTVDMHRFRDLVARARTAGDDSESISLYEQAFALWRGEAFSTLDTSWLNATRESLHRERLAAELDRNDLSLRAGHHAALLTELHALAAEYPLDERVAGQLMLALYRSGRQADALALYRRVRSRLVDELGTDPGPALARLHQQVLEADAGLAAPSPRDDRTRPRSSSRPARGPTVPRQLPAPSGSFAGRTGELAELSRIMLPAPPGPPAVPITVIAGIGGIGKTSLALRWAHDNMDQFPDGQLYVNLRGYDPSGEPVKTPTAVRGLLDALGVDPARIPVDADAQAALYRSVLGGRRVLVVLDDARDAGSVIPLLPGVGSAVVVTSRHQLVGLVSAHGARPLFLGVLSDTEARQLLVNVVGAARTAAEPEAVTLLLRHCAGLPLALGIIAARAATDPARPLAALADEVTEISTRLDAFDPGDLAVSLRAVLALSVDALSPDAARVFRLLGLAPGPDIGPGAVASLTALPLDRVRLLLRELVAAHMVHEHVPGRFRLHDLVRQYAAEEAHRHHCAGERRAALHRVLDHYLYHAHASDRRLHPHRAPIAVPAPQPGVCTEPIEAHEEAMAWLNAEHPVVLAAIDLAAQAGFGAHAWQMAWSLTTYLDRRARWRDQAAIHATALRAAQEGSDRHGVARAHHGLGRAHARLRSDDEARDHLLRALAAFRELADPAGQGRIHFDVGWLLERQTRYREALTHDREALELFRSAADRSGEANALNVIGWHHMQLGEYSDGLTYCRQALAVLRDLGERRGEAGTWDSIGYAHHQLRQHEQATTCYRRALDLLRTLGDTSQEAVVLIHLGDNHAAAGDGRSARDAWRQALAILDELGQPEADDVRSRLAGDQERR